MKAYLVFRQQPDSSYPERSSELWRGDEPKPGVNIPASAKVCPLPDDTHIDKVAEFKRVTDKQVVVDPLSPPAVKIDPLNLLNREIETKLTMAAQDKTMTDDAFVAYKNKLLRAQHMDNIEDKQNQIAEAEAVKQ